MKYWNISSVKAVRQYYRLSRLFQPLNVKPKDAIVRKDEAISISQKVKATFDVDDCNSGKY